jgi:hypothetical protein
MKCRYCEKDMATQADYDTIAEGEGKHLCWSDFSQPCIDAEEALDIARARIAELEAIIANAEAHGRAVARTVQPLVGSSVGGDK